MACSSVEDELGQGLGQFGLAHPGGPHEDEAADGPVGVLQAGAGPAHRVGHRPHGLFLADHPAAQPRSSMLHQFVAFALQQLADRNAGPAGNHLGDVLVVHLFLEHFSRPCSSASLARLWAMRRLSSVALP
jgi:hypothetical protein